MTNKLKNSFKLFVLGSAFVGLKVFAAQKIQAVYEVPVPEELKRFATYSVSCKADSYGENPNEMSFRLPAVLVGENKKFKMARSQENPDLWVGDNVSGTCQKVEEKMNCNVQFHDLDIDQRKVEREIFSEFKDPAMIAGKLKVALRFGDEPIGIISYVIQDSTELYPHKPK